MQGLFKTGINMILTQKKQITVAIDEIDFANRLKPSAILQYFQDLAGEHAYALGIGHDDMLKKGLFWVISSLGYRIESYPTFGAHLTLDTYPKFPKHLFADRDFYLADERGRVLTGTSKWCALSLSDRKFSSVPALFPYDKECFFAEDAVPGGIAKIVIKGQPSATYEYVALPSYLDRNRHVNNARYGDFVYDSNDVERLENCKIKEFDINYIREIKCGDRFVVARYDDGDESFYEGAVGDVASFRARILWEYAEK